MNLKSIMLALAFVLTTSAAFAQLRPYPPTGGQTNSGKPSNDPNRPGQYVPPPNQGGGGYYPPPNNGGYYPPPSHGGGGYYPPPNNGGYYPPPSHGGGGYYPPPNNGGYYPPPPSNYYPPPPPPSYYPPTPPPSYDQRIVKQVYVGRSVGDEMYQLSYYADLSSYYGWEVTAVRASTRPNSPYRTVVSLVDSSRNVLATQTNPGYQVALFPYNSVCVGNQDLYLWVQGSTYIESIEVELRRR